MSARHEDMYDIRGMTCASCAKRVERALGKVEGVESATVDLVRERARVLGSAREAELKEAVAKAGYELVPHGSTTARGARSNVDATAIAALVIAAGLLAVDLGAPALFGERTPWITLALSAFVTLGLGGPIFVRAVRLALERDASMDTLVALGSGAALVLAALSLTSAHHGAHGHSDASTGALVIAIVLGGKAIERRAKQRSAAALDAVIAKDTAPVRVTRHGETSEVPATELRVGDDVHVAPFAVVPADGALAIDAAYVDEGLVTGESRPALKARGDTVLGGTLNGASPLRITISAVGAASMRGRLEAETASALARPPRTAALADRASAWIVPVVASVATLTFVVRIALGETLLDALRPAISVLVIACPCALGLATPAALVAALARAAREGIVVRDAGRFVMLARATHLFFDKTGTLTEGRPRVTEIVRVSERFDERTLLTWIASIEADSEHPTGHALFLSAMERGIAALPASDVRALPGRGIEGTVAGHALVVEALDSAREAALSADVRARVDALRGNGHSVSGALVDGALEALVAVRDRVRPTTRAVLQTLTAEHLHFEMLSGDHASAAAAIARDVGLAPELVHAPLRPEEKTAFVERAKSADVVVVMIGDGVNDAPALAAADVGIAIGQGAGSAIRSAAITLLDGDLARIRTARALARVTDRTIRANLAWAFAYNALAIPLAAFGALDRLGGPAAAAAAMAGSSIAVVLWSLRIAKVPLGTSSPDHAHAK